MISKKQGNNTPADESAETPPTDVKKVSPPRPKAPPPPSKGPKNTRGFGGTQIRRNAGRGR